MNNAFSRIFSGVPAVAICLILSGGRLAGKEIFLPKESDAVFSLDLPKGWRNESQKGGGALEAYAPNDNAMVMSFLLNAEEFPEDTMDLVGEVESIFEETVKKPKFGKPEEVTVNGMDARQISGQGRNASDRSPVSFDMIFFKAAEGSIGLFYAEYYAEDTEQEQAEMNRILDTLKPVEAADEEEEEAADDEDEADSDEADSDDSGDSEEADDEDGSDDEDSGEDGMTAGTEKGIPDVEGQSAERKPRDGGEHLEPGDWDMTLAMDAIYPSWVVATATVNFGIKNGPDQLGEPMGTVGAMICAPEDDCPVEVEVSSSRMIRPSKFVGKLPKAGTVYYVYPKLKFDYDGLLSVKQPVPEDLSVKVTLNGEEKPEKVKSVQVRSVGDCVYGFEDAKGDMVQAGWMFAAYVNENHPLVDKILRDALNLGKVSSFSGYQGDADAVKKEVEAVWDALKNKGFKYSSITTSSGESSQVSCQNIRLLGDSVKTSQANCADGTVLFASVFRKLGLETFLMLLPDHMFVAVALDPNKENILYLETTMLGDSTFEEAVQAGKQEYKESAKRFASRKEDDSEFEIVDVTQARRMGVLPLKEN